VVGRTRFELSERICVKYDILCKRVVNESNRLLIVIVAVVIAWLLASESIAEKIVIPLSVGLVISYIVAVMASFPPIMTIPFGENEAIRAYSPVAYPFCIQQYRNYDAHLFSYAVIFGWPEGTPLLQFALQEDQSHLMHAQHYLSGLSLGLLLLLVVIVLVGTLSLIERKSAITRGSGKSSILLLVSQQLTLVILIASLYVSGNIIYPLGGAFVLLVTLYPTLRAVCDRGS
jgi:fucose 4-O-acetylase-like acetyltransferase